MYGYQRRARFRRGGKTTGIGEIVELIDIWTSRVKKFVGSALDQEYNCAYQYVQPREFFGFACQLGLWSISAPRYFSGRIFCSAVPPLAIKKEP